MGPSVFSCHVHCLGISLHSFDFALLLLECLCCIGTSIFDWWLCLTIAAHDDVAVATGFILQRFRGVALHGIEFGALNLSGESLKVVIEVEWGCELFLVILKGELVFPLLQHLHPDCSLPNPSALGSVDLQQVFRSVAMKTALEEVFALPVLALVLE